MAIPLLEYAPKSQNQRVAGYEKPGEEKPRIYSTDNILSPSELDELIWAAYRQIFSEHQILKSTRQTFLESQLKYGQITVRDFIRGLATSDAFRRLNYEPNSNYRFVEMCVQRILGRDVYSEREKIAWSIVLATKGLEGFIDALVNSEEYLKNFGENTVPYQLRRILPQRAIGETPFNLKTPRYGPYHRAQLGFPQVIWQNQVRRFTPQEKQPKAGDPSLYLGMARQIPVSTNLPRISTQNLNYEALVPYRRR
ncbi:MAG: phycobilisome rod-core linker polypeptide [Oscillatoriaceae bacterium SKW80]|nr:phycobilisome rod-core linker polypeptide [Oscillatoriaceae bacterium SKYG93]MCX8121574.1 phycobilisome rod-core linker polypeptide [Oscillatoriaceae bacterium SKW80]MDW8452839.1 phycobilisome rod-core linker polypeptide [Oscillatoriaceae cyanobacterium SKYGB_i_bin93]HIK27919.1 phycobilisome rod-core linker polypeptide [Oscillatoriaceae cyanobacterium M7585_C2015_266]